MDTINRSLSSRLKCLLGNRRGQAQIEFLLSVIVVLFVVIGIAQMIAMIYTYTVMADAAKEGVRYAIVHGCDLSAATCSGLCTPACTDSTATNVENYAKIYLAASLQNPATIPVSVSYPDGSSLPTNRVRVTIAYPYQPLFGLRWPTVTVKAAAEGRIFY